MLQFCLERLMFTYEELENDLNIIATYELIDRFDFKPLALHGVTHVTNVVRIVEEVLSLLGESEDVINIGKIAAFLHDLGMKEGKKNHAKRSVKEAKRILKGKQLTFKQKRTIFEAIKWHSVNGKQKDIVGATLIFADKLDADKTRLGEMGYDVQGFKETQHIEKIDFALEKTADGSTLDVIFHATPKFNAREFVGYYHSAKIFKSVKVFAEFIGSEYKIFLNNDLWVDKNGVKPL